MAYTGSLFDGWDGGGDRAGVANRFTDADVNAVGLLSVEIPPRAVIEVLVRRADALSMPLREIPADVDLHDVSTEIIGPASAAWRLWDALISIDGIGWVTASKLLSRKRPRLLPVYDRHVREVVGHLKDYWASLHRALHAHDGAVAARLQAIRQELTRRRSASCGSSMWSCG